MLIHCNFDELVSPREVKAHPKNRNKHPESQIERLAKILSYQGWRYPIKISNRSGYCTSGHGRLLAAIKNGWTEVPVNYQDYDSDEQEYADVQSDNAIASWSELDLAGINLDLGDLGPDFDIDLLGLEDFTLDVAEKLDPKTDEDDVPEEPVEPKAKLGDIYQLGEHRLMCGDATKDVDTLLDGLNVDMVFTDPPYGIGFEYNSHKDQKGKAYLEFCNSWFFEIKSRSRFTVISTGWAYNKYWYMNDPDDCFYWLSKNKRTGGSRSHFRKIEPLFIWGRPETKYNFDYFEQTTEIEAELKGKHTCPKPVSLIVEIISHGGKSVLDVFGGSGTTIIACEKTNKNCYMMEFDPKYIDVIIERWENYTGKKAELIKNAYDEENEEENS